MKAYILLGTEKYKEALKCYWISYSLSNEISDLNKITTCYIFSDKFKEAMCIIEEIEKISPNNSLLYYLKGIILENCEELCPNVKSRDMFLKSLELDERNTLTLFELAKIEMSENRYPTALEQYYINNNLV